MLLSLAIWRLVMMANFLGALMRRNKTVIRAKNLVLLMISLR